MFGSVLLECRAMVAGLLACPARVVVISNAVLITRTRPGAVVSKRSPAASAVRPAIGISRLLRHRSRPVCSACQSNCHRSRRCRIQCHYQNGQPGAVTPRCRSIEQAGGGVRAQAAERWRSGAAIEADQRLKSRHMGPPGPIVEHAQYRRPVTLVGVIFATAIAVQENALTLACQ